MRKRYLGLLFFGLVGIGLFSYNYWSYSCGRCNSESLLTLGLPAKILLGINFLALVALVLVKLWAKDRRLLSACSCGQSLHGAWQFCPRCGQARPMKV